MSFQWILPPPRSVCREVVLVIQLGTASTVPLATTIPTLHLRLHLYMPSTILPSLFVFLVYDSAWSGNSSLEFCTTPHLSVQIQGQSSSPRWDSAAIASIVNFQLPVHGLHMKPPALYGAHVAPSRPSRFITSSSYTSSGLPPSTTKLANCPLLQISEVILELLLLVALPN